jgi:hypothetical protein
MNERILNSFEKRRVAKTLRSNCEGILQRKLPSCQRDMLRYLVFVDSATEEA